MLTALVVIVVCAAPGGDGCTTAPERLPIPANLLKPIPPHGGVPPITNPAGDPEAMLFGSRAEQRGYEDQLKLIRQKYFGSQGARSKANGIAELRQFTDPASFQPMIEIFAREAPEVRDAMLDHFAANGDYGQAALAYVAISDQEKSFRTAATQRLRRPATESVMRVVDAALRQNKDDFVNNAGALAGNLNIIAAIPPMIFAQVADAPAGQTGDLAWIAVGTTKSYVANVVPIVGDNSGAFAPVIGQVFEGCVFQVQDAVMYSYRGDLHNSLVAMTTSDFGESTEHLAYDMRAWYEWFNTRYVPFKQRQAEEMARLQDSERQLAEQRVRPTAPAAPPEAPAPRDPTKPDPDAPKSR